MGTLRCYKECFTFFFLESIRISGKSINFDVRKINKISFYKNKKLSSLNDIDVNKILVSKNESYGTKNSLKYFTGYNDGNVITPLCILLPQMIGFVKHFNSKKRMSFKVSDNKLSKRYKKIWEKVGNLLSIEFNSEPVYGDEDKYINTKIKVYGDKVNTNFQSKKVPKENASYKCISLIMLDSVITANKKYYPQTLLEECKYVIRKNKMETLLISLSSSDERDIESDNESYEKDNESDNESDK